MHALNSYIAQIGDTVYAVIPTYWNPSHFIRCKFYVEFAWHSLDSVYYHGIITELLDDEYKSLTILSTANLKAIKRSDNTLTMINLAMPTLFSKEQMLAYVQTIQQDYKLDLPGPFVAPDMAGFDKLNNEIRKYFAGLLSSLDI
jgi:hypothetical protein